MKTKIGIVKGEETCDIETRDKLSTHDRHPHNDAEYLNSIPRLPQPRRGDVINQTLVTTRSRRSGDRVNHRQASCGFFFLSIFFLA